MAVLRNLKKEQYNIKCLLETVLSGATWPAERISQSYPDVSPICCRCGEEPEDALHRYWTCKANHTIEDDKVQSTQDLVASAVAKCKEYPCLWSRGLLPAGFINIPPEADPVQTLDITYVNPEQACFGSGTYYGDASGGTHTRYPDIRRVGCAFAGIDHSGVLIFAAHFPLPGDVQTVSRGVPFALIALVRRAEQFTDMNS